MNVPKITLPYIKGTMDWIMNILKRRNITISFTSPNTIRGFFAKDSTNPRQHKGVNEILFSFGKVYIGEIGCSTYIHLKEHDVDINFNHIDKSTLVEHSHNTTHHICMGKTKLITKEEYHIKRRMREALEIEKRNSILNRDTGLKLSDTWRPIINQLKYYKGHVV
jgi:hypothetical protein